jgi:TolA-binding protein
MLAVTDQEIEFFKNDVSLFSEIDKQIKELKKQMKPFQEKIRELTKQKKQKQEEVLTFMESNEIDICNTDSASFELKDTKTTKQVTKGDVYDRIYKYISEDKGSEVKSSPAEEKAKHLHDFIYIEGREVNVSKTLKAK